MLKIMESLVNTWIDVRDTAKQDKLMQAIDSVNNKLGAGALQVASAKGNGQCIARKDNKSFCYTTRLPKVG